MNLLKFRNDTENFRNLIYERSTMNIADSFYSVAITIALVQLYQIDVSMISLFTLLGMLPFSYGYLMDRIRDKKRALLIVQMLHILCVVSLILVFHYRLSLLYAAVLNVCLHLVNTMVSALQLSIVPVALDYQDDLIDASIDIQYLTGNVLDILSNFVASVLLGGGGFLSVCPSPKCSDFCCWFVFHLQVEADAICRGE